MIPVVTLTDKFGAHFSPSVQARGQALVDALAVALVQSSPRHVSAEVTDGRELFEACLRVDGRELRAGCGCVAAVAGQGCEHLWGALCAAEAFGDLGLALKQNVRNRLAFAGRPAAAAPVPTAPAPPRALPAPVVAAPPAPRELVYESEAPARQALGAGRPPPVAHRSAPAARTFGAPVSPVAGGRPSPESQTGAQLIFVMTLCESVEAGVALDTYWRPRPGGPLQPYRFEPFQPRPDWVDDTLVDALQPAWLGREVGGGQGFLLPHRLAAVLLPHLVDTGRCVWRRTRRDEAINHVELRNGEALPWDFQIQVSELPNGEYTVSGRVVRGSQAVALEQVAWCGECGFLIAWDKLEPVETHRAVKWMRFLQVAAGRRMRRPELDRLVQALLAESSVATDAFPAAVRYTPAELGVTGQLFVRTATFKYRNREQLHADLSFRYGGVTLEEGDARETVLLPSTRQNCRRDLAAEEALRNTLRTLDFRWAENAAKEDPGWKLLPEKLDAVVRQLVDQDWLIVAEGKTYRKPREMQAHVSGGESRDWFELQGSVTFGDEVVPLPKLLAAQKSGVGYVLLDDGSRGVLPTEWLLKFTVLTEIGEIDGEALKLRRSQAVIINGLLEQLEIPVDESFRELRSELAAFRGFTPAAPPETFQGVLRPYQCEGLGWLQMLARLGLGGCLADDMGLGKTVQVLALLESRRLQKTVGPSLIVLPKSLIFNWLKEARKFTPQLRTVEYTGGGRHGARRLFPAVDLVLTTYGTLRQDAPLLSNERFDYCILDESQAIKNADSLTAKAAKLIRAEHRLVMSGTPVENHVRELFSQFEFLNPALFGSSAVMDKRAGAEALGEAEMAILAQALRPYILRRTKAEVAKELPAKTEQVLYCELDEAQRAHYDELKQFYQDRLQRQKAAASAPAVAAPDGGGGTAGAAGAGSAGGTPRRIDILAALLRLRQCACHPGLVNERFLGEASAKLELLLEKVGVLVEEKHKVLVFSQFTAFLKLVGQRLDAAGIRYAYLDGQTVDRDAEVHRFQNEPECEAFLISLKAGGVGLNLTAAEYVFLLDPWWNPAVEAQAIDRAYRIGQTRPVFAYRLIARGTVEEKVLAMQEDKRLLAAGMISPTGDFLQTLTAADLSALLD